MKNIRSSESAKHQVIETTLRDTPPNPSAAFRERLRSGVLDFYKNTAAVSSKNQKNSLSSFCRSLRSKVLFAFQQVFHFRVFLKASTFARLLHKDTLSPSASFRSRLKKHVLTSFKSIGQTEASGEPVLSRGFWEKFRGIFKWGLVPVVAVIAILLFRPESFSPPPENILFAQNIPAESRLPEDSVLSDTNLFFPEAEEDLVFFALLDDFDKTLEDLENLEHFSSKIALLQK